MKEKQPLILGVLAHVDAGKTTLSEAMLYLSGTIRQLGRVDHQDAFLDTNALERERGITIFSKQAVFPLGEKEVTLLDTPGHVDFSTEMERTLQVLDYAVLVVSGTDGVQSHTRTVWRLLRRYGVPVFVFVNKMDLPGTQKQDVLKALQRDLSDRCEDFGAPRTQEFWENIAANDERALEEYLESGEVSQETIRRMIREGTLYPCYFGSALKLQGMNEFLQGLEKNTVVPAYPQQFGAKVYKISRDQQGNRLTWLKVTGGTLKVRTLLKGGATQKDAGEADWEEKVDQIRLYSGTKYQTLPQAVAGTVCTVTGLSRTRPGEGLGFEMASEQPVLEPVLSCRVFLPEGTAPHRALQQLQELEEEDPQLHIVWNEQLREIHLQMMGEVQLEILKRIIAERFGLEVTFGAGGIVYRETIQNPVEGVGHFEPLRHYAEVHLLLEPGPRGSGMQYDTDCSEDMLDKNWQRLVLTHLEERTHPGVLIGAPVTDLKITLIAGRSHLKHTEGGDFRQATYRAVRQGLKKAQSVLLEPYYSFRLEVPSANVGRAMSDLQRMSASFDPPRTEGEFSVLTGSGPVSELREYQLAVAAYTQGQGRFSCSVKGYEPCHNAQQVIEESGYDSDRDTLNPADSVFCSHGAGFVVKWNEVERYMHVDSGLRWDKPEQEAPAPVRGGSAGYTGTLAEDEELRAIFEKTYGPVKRREMEPRPQTADGGWEGWRARQEQSGPEYLLADGYNLIFAWDDLKELARTNVDAARQKLMDELCNYQGYKKCEVILVFDAYRVPRGVREVVKYHNIHVVYTQEAETADAYIAKASDEIGKHYRVRVATSDYAEQLIILGHGALRISASAFREELEQVKQQIRQIVEETHAKTRLKFATTVRESWPEPQGETAKDRPED